MRLALWLALTDTWPTPTERKRHAAACLASEGRQELKACRMSPACAHLGHGAGAHCAPDLVCPRAALLGRMPLFLRLHA